MEITERLAQCGENAQLLYPIDQAALSLMVLIIMFGMGSGLTTDNFKYIIEKPRGILIGFVSQFGVMPLLAYTLATYLEFPPVLAIALILVGCLPAGTTSNMFTYFSRGDVALSISMTTCSTLAALFMLPLLLNLYGEGFAAQINVPGAEDGTVFEIPYTNIIVSLAAVLVPVVLGMILRRYSPGWAKAAEDTASFMGIIVILYLTISFLSRSCNRELMFYTPWTVYFGSVIVGVAGFALGYILATILRLVPRHRRTVALETGIQNGPLAFAIVILSFGASEVIQNEMLWLPILYSFFIVITSSFATLFFRRIGKLDFEIYENETVQKRLFGDHWEPVPMNEFGQGDVEAAKKDQKAA